jgi:hypothetical protein
MFDMNATLKALAAKRPVFHSEADFQHALAWKIHQHRSTCQVRLEAPLPVGDKRGHIDIWMPDDTAFCAVELKYKTRRVRVEVNGETFDLLDQSAQDFGRYDFLKDLERLERIVSANDDIVGYAVFLTNDSAYWTPPTRTGTIDAGLRIHDGRRIEGRLGWRRPLPKWLRERRADIVVNGVYNLSWQDYAEPSRARYGRFRYLIVEVVRQ